MRHAGPFALAGILGSVAAVAAVAAVAGAAFADVPFSEIPRGPPIGNVLYRSEISAGSVADRDEFVTPLIAGEVLTVRLAAERGSGLAPVLTLLGPDGTDRTPAVTVNRTGTSATFRKFAVDVTGAWTVRVAGADGTTGRYGLKCGVRSNLRSVWRKQGLGVTDPAERTHPFDAVEGATVAAVVKLGRGSQGGGLTGVTDPTGAPIPLGTPRKRGATSSYAGIVVGGGAGACVATVGLDEGRATYDLSLRIAPPARPRGVVALSADEPHLTLLASPVTGNASQVIELTGANFSSTTFPVVWFGAKRATVLTVSTGGSKLAVVPPEYPEGTVVGVAVVNPDGQAGARDSYFSYAVPAPARLLRLSPATASVYANGTLTYTVSLTRNAPAGGATLTLAASGGVGSVPPFTTIASGGASTTFLLAVGAATGAGRVTATYGDVTLAADFSVVPAPGGGGGGDPPPPLPDEIDVGGWTLTQANSARTYTIPAGTKLKQGGYLVVGRACVQSAFETFWGVTFGSGVVFLTNDPNNTATNSLDDWPSINGGETFELRDAGGNRVDGVTPAMAAAAGEVWSRAPGSDGTLRASWTVSTSATPGGAPTPGSGQGTSTEKHGVYISEFSDASGTGSYPYEFVELHFDGLKP